MSCSLPASASRQSQKRQQQQQVSAVLLFHNNSFSFIRTDYSALCLREYSDGRVQTIVLRTRFLPSPISFCEYSSTSCIVFRFSPSYPDLLRSCDGIVQVNPPAFIIAVNCRPATADFVKDTLFFCSQSAQSLQKYA